MRNSSKESHSTPYLPATAGERREMLEAVGAGDITDLFQDIPEAVRLGRDLCLPGPESEMEVLSYFRQLASKNLNIDDYVSFLGGGIYDHFVPEVVSHVIGRSEFYTSYTPYQAELSQGMLQAIYEYQTLICQLTGMEVSNASLYDGATALAEAGIMACDIVDRNEILISAAVHPSYRRVLQTYTSGMGLSIREIAMADGLTDVDGLRNMITASTGAVIVQQPNFFGNVESVAEIGVIARSHGAQYVVSVDPISLGMMAPPGEYGADIVTGEGQSLGISPSFGGPLLGLFATRRKHIYRLPGRLVGATEDTQGKRGYVLALQTREQHIRRERATSNICTNQALMALAATVYLSVVGKRGLADVADLCFQKAHYAHERLLTVPGISVPWQAGFFKEFVVKASFDIDDLNDTLLDAGIIGGLPLGSYHKGMNDCLLISVTEKRTRQEIDSLIDGVRRYAGKHARAAHI